MYHQVDSLPSYFPTPFTHVPRGFFFASHFSGFSEFHKIPQNGRTVVRGGTIWCDRTPSAGILKGRHFPLLFCYLFFVKKLFLLKPKIHHEGASFISFISFTDALCGRRGTIVEFRIWLTLYLQENLE